MISTFICSTNQRSRGIQQSSPSFTYRGTRTHDRLCHPILWLDWHFFFPCEVTQVINNSGTILRICPSSVAGNIKWIQRKQVLACPKVCIHVLPQGPNSCFTWLVVCRLLLDLQAQRSCRKDKALEYSGSLPAARLWKPYQLGTNQESLFWTRFFYIEVLILLLFKEQGVVSVFSSRGRMHQKQSTSIV
jgi:hypothetical protein